MTIEARTAIYGSNGLQQPRRDSTSSNGYQDSPSEDDGYFTSAVSVQHKVRSFIILHFNMGIHWRQKKNFASPVNYYRVFLNSTFCILYLS